MLNLENGTFYDLDGNEFALDFLNGTATLYGSHFHGAIPVALLATAGLWAVAFIALLYAYMKIVGHAGPDDRARKHLRWPIMGLSIIFMIMSFALDFANRIMHEMQLRESGLILLLPVFETIAYGIAYGLLIAFCLWQFTPVLLAYARVSEKRQKTTLLWFKGLVFFVGFLDVVKTIWTVVNYITEAILIVENKTISNFGHTVRTLDRASVVGAGAADVAFNAVYFICVLTFAVLACMTIRTEHKGKTLDRPTRTYLPAIAISIVLRTALDLAWSIAFNLLTDFHTMKITLTYRLFHSVLYGVCSVVLYASILGITAHNDPRDSEVRHDLVKPPKDWDKPSCIAMCLLCGLAGVFMRGRMVDDSAGMAQANHAQYPSYGPARGTPPKQMDASGSYYSVPQSIPGQYRSTSDGFRPPPSPLKYGRPPLGPFEPGRNGFDPNGPQRQRY